MPMEGIKHVNTNMRGNKVGLCIWDADIIFLKRGFDYILQDADHRVEIESRARL